MGSVHGLTRQLEAFMDGIMERADPETRQALQQVGEAMTADGLAERALRAGDAAPDFSLPDQFGRTVTLHELLAKGPVVLTFFRGGWCPFCTIALRALAGIRAELKKAHGEVVAISPQTTGVTLDTAERNGLGFPILADHGNAVARRYGLVWELGPEVRAVYERLGHALPRINGTTDWTLPIPAGFVIGRDGKIAYAHVDTRVTSRLEPRLALEAVRELEAGVAPG